MYSSKYSSNPGWRSTLAGWQAKLQIHRDFLLLLALFVTFRISSVLFFRPGGYTRDYTDLIFYLRRASWEDFGFWPYRDYWSEYPPLFAWFSVWIDALSRRIPLWEDDRLWYAAFFGVSMVIAETITLFCLYRLARRLYGNEALRVIWLYMGLFLPVYFLSGWYDALPVATILVSVMLLVSWPTLTGLVLLGLVAGIGGLLKLVPLGVLTLLPLATTRRLHWLISSVIALAVVIGGYAIAYLNGPVMTLTSLRSLVDRSGWATIYAWVNGYTRLGKVLGDVFDPAANMTLYTSRYPQGLVWACWLLLGGVLLFLVWRQQPAPHPPYKLVGFAALTYAILLLAYPAWNPQYALYLLPLMILLWPNGRGLFYALLLSALVLLEHPVYHNLIGPDYAPIYRRLIDIDYRQLFLAIIVARTVVLAAITLDMALTLVPKAPRLRWLPLLMAGATALVMLTLLPRFGQAYAAGRLATSPVRPLAIFVNAQEPPLPLVSSQLKLSRQLRPFLQDPKRFTLIGGRPGRLEPLPAIAAQGPFVYIHSQDDDAELVTKIEQNYACPQRTTLNDWELWFCQAGPTQPLARFDQHIDLTAASLPDRLSETAHLTLFWQTTEPITKEYTVFVHLVDASGAMIGQWDQAPGAGEAPTPSWSPGHLVVDEYQIPVKLAGSNPPYRILVGLYDPQSGARLNVQESQHAVTDARLELKTFTEHE